MDFPTPPANIAAKLEELNAWSTQRQAQYGSLESQLNMLFDDIDSGKFGEIAKTGSWYLHIKSVKDSIAKPDVATLQAELDALIAAEE